MTLKSDIARLVTEALSEAQHAGVLPAAAVEDIPIERPQNPEHGDYACSLPLKLARPMRMSPMAIGEKLVERMASHPQVGEVNVAPPGFINVRLDESWLSRQVDVVREQGDAYGSVDVGRGSRVQVEFISINPTGPLHVAHARGAVIGSALASVLEAAGYDVQREYYFNDAGNQIAHFERSLYVRYLQHFERAAEMPPDGYMGDYMVELAAQMAAEHGERFLGLPEETGLAELGKLGLAKMLSAIRSDVELLRVFFDVWFSEGSLFSGGQFDRAMALLRERDHVEERDGAVWFKSTALGEEQDKVLIRTNGAPTYFATDVAYHYNKFIERGFDQVINVWGADHQGHVSQMKQVVGALGLPPERLTLIVHQMVTLKRGDQIVRLSKRSGDLITLRELVDEVGTDACRYFFLARSPESQMEFDMELAMQQSADNPVYYVQYAHARIASIIKLARERGIEFGEGDVSLLSHPAELALIRKMLLLPELVEAMAKSLEPHHLPHYAAELATAFHGFYQQCRVVSSDPEDLAITRARLKLVDAARIVLARSLSLMSMGAPDEM